MNSILKKSLGFVLVLFLMVFSLSSVVKVKATEVTVTYTITSKTSVSTSGTAPAGSSASFSQTYDTAKQMTKGNSMTLTLTGYSGMTIKGITLSMHSNASGGRGSFSAVAGTTTISSIEENSSFSSEDWYGAWSTEYVNITPSISNNTYAIGQSDQVVLTISASTNSLYCESFTITYENPNASTINLQTIALTNLELKPGQTGRTTITYNPANATNKAVTYAIASGSEYVNLAQDGTITAKAAGVATLTVTPTDNHASPQTCTITITDYPAPALTVGNTYYFTGKKNATNYELKQIEIIDSSNIQAYDNFPSLFDFVTEEGCYPNTVAFKHNDSYLAFVSGNVLTSKNTIDAESSWLVSVVNEKIVIKNVKTQNMQIMFNSGSNRFGCYAGTQADIELYDPSIASVLISTTSAKAYFGETLNFNVATNIQNPVVTWTSSNTSAATIDSNGVLHPQGIGRTNIKATINDVDSNIVEITVLPNPENPITVAQANAIADFVGTTKTTELFMVDGTITLVDQYTLTLEDGTGTIAVNKYNSYTDSVNGKEVRVTGKILKYNNTTNEFTDTPTITFYHTVTFDSDGGSAVASQKVLDGAKATRPTPDPTKDGFTFNGWKNADVDWDFNSNTVTSNITLTAQWAGSSIGGIIELLNSTQAYMSLAYKYSRINGTATDTLTRALTGISGTGYGDWNGKHSVTDTVYSGNSSGSNDSIALRSGSGSGIIATSSGYARKVTISFNSNTDDGRKVDIYGSDTEYASPADLYSNGRGTLLGSISYGTSTELTIDGSYRYIGIRSSGNTIYIDSIEIQWYGLYTYTESDFRLRCGFDNTSFEDDLAALSGEATYGIEVSTSSKTSRYASNNQLVNTSGDMKYVLIDLGDALTNSDRLDVEFTVKVYVELDAVRYYATNDAMTKTYSVVSMVDAYYANDEIKPLILNLYNLLVSLGKIN